MLGTMGSGKTRALLFSLITQLIDFPGCRLILARDERINLYKTTLESLFTMFTEMGLEGDKHYIFRQQSGDIRVFVGDKVSKIQLFGLNTGDYKEKLKSFEPFCFFGDEFHSVGEEKLNFALTRVGRDQPRHRWSYQERIERAMVEPMLWEGEYIKFGKFQEGMDFFEIASTEKQKLLEHEIGRPFAKYCSNDMGNDWIWKRLINYRGDKPHPNQDEITPLQFMKWVNSNVGISEIYIPPRDLPRFRPGNIVELYDGRTAEVLESRDDDLIVDAGGVDTEVANKHTTTLVLERLCIYGFSLENESLNEDNIENFYYIDKDTRDQYLHGLGLTQMGQMFPEFSMDVHVIPSEDIPEDWTVYVGLDYNIDMACAAFLAENALGDLVVFDEYEGTSGDPTRNAHEILTKINHPWNRVYIYYDSAMDARDPTNPNKSVAKMYRDAGMKRMRTAVRDRNFGAGAIKKVLAVHKEPGRRARPNLWVMDNCKTLIYGRDIDGTPVNCGFTNMTWEDYHAKRRDHLLDALRYAIASIKARRPDTETKKQTKSHIPTWRRK